MSMPVISMPCNPVNMCQAITDLIESIALEETALSHILNAKGEKLQRAIAMEDITLCQLLEVNADVANMVTTINDLENTLKDKLEFISTNLYYPTKEAGCGCSF